MRRPWFDRACAAIDAARARGEAEGLSGRELLDRIDAAYPFGPRSHWPYKQWLKARRLRCGDLPGVRSLPRPRQAGDAARVVPMPGQLDLFEREHESISVS